jgi:hypothetical protein
VQVNPKADVILIDVLDSTKLAERKRLREVAQADAARAVADLWKDFDGLDDQRFSWTPAAPMDLFKSASNPRGASQSRIEKFPAIDPLAISFLRGAVSNNDLPAAGVGAQSKTAVWNVPGESDSTVPGSKAVRLIADLQKLPKGERSVVFSCSEDYCNHLGFVLKKQGIGCMVLVKTFSGGKNTSSASQSAAAITEWK